MHSCNQDFDDEHKVETYRFTELIHALRDNDAINYVWA